MSDGNILTVEHLSTASGTLQAHFDRDTVTMRSGLIAYEGATLEASGSIPLERPHGAPRSAITRTSTPRSLARMSAPTMPEPTVGR